MKRVKVSPRADFEDRARLSGVRDVVRSIPSSNSENLSYRAWDEHTMYVFGSDEINRLIDAVAPVVQMSRDAVDFLLDGEWGTLGLTRDAFSFVRESFDNRRKELISRYDFSYQPDGSLSLVGIQGDAPSLIVETARAQRAWLLERFRKPVDLGTMTQLNTMPEMISSVFSKLTENSRNISILGGEGDWITTSYLESLALDSGLVPHVSRMKDLRWNERTGEWIDSVSEAVVTSFYKNRPWDMILPSPALSKDFISHSEIFSLMLEPAWKIILSCRAVIPALHHLFPQSDLIPESTFEDSFGMSDDVVCSPVNPFTSRNEMAVLGGRTFTSWGEPLKDFSSQKSLVRRRLHVPRRYRDSTWGGYRFPYLSFFTVGGHLAGLGVQESLLPLLGTYTTFRPHVVVM